MLLKARNFITGRSAERTEKVQLGICLTMADRNVLMASLGDAKNFSHLCAVSILHFANQSQPRQRTFLAGCRARDLDRRDALLTFGYWLHPHVLTHIQQRIHFPYVSFSEISRAAVCQYPDLTVSELKELFRHVYCLELGVDFDPAPLTTNN